MTENLTKQGGYGVYEDGVVEVLVTVSEDAKDLPLPSYATKYSACVDLAANVHQDLAIAPGDAVMVPTGLTMQIPPEYEAQIRSRSGLAYKHSIMVLNSPATIDADYRGEIRVVLKNLGDKIFVVTRGMRIAQLMLNRIPKIKFTQVEYLDETERGTGGFGSTGLK